MDSGQRHYDRVPMSAQEGETTDVEEESVDSQNLESGGGQHQTPFPVYQPLAEQVYIRSHRESVRGGTPLDLLVLEDVHRQGTKETEEDQDSDDTED